MKVLVVQEIEKSYGDRQILRGCNFTVDTVERVGIVGANGAGKSTLLRLISEVESADAGVIYRNGSVAILEQEPVLSGETVEEAVREASAWHQQLLDEYEQAINDENWEKMATCQDRLDMVGWDLSHNISSMLQRVQAPPADRSLKGLSGGEERRVALARTLLSNADLLILDEPTNHLDAETIEWLEAFLSGYRGAVLLVTHDRYLLEAVATRIIEIEDGLCVGYDGSYGDYLVASAERQARLRQSESRRLKLIAVEAEWAARSPAARSTKQKARLQRLDTLRDQRKIPRERDLILQFSTDDKFGATLLECQDLSLSFGDTQIFEKVSLSLLPKQRLGILGPNGAGKSSLLKIISGELLPSGGDVLRQSRLKIGMLNQQRSGLKESDTVFEAAGGGADYVTVAGQQLHVAGFLQRFLFGREMLGQHVSLLSGGERARLLMAKLMLEGANLLLLDEPTNDLDLLTLRALEESLLEYGGAVVVVTHDRAFLDRVCNSVLAFEDGRTQSYADRHQANLAAKSRRIEARKSEKRTEIKSTTKTKTKKTTPTKKLSFKESRELKDLPDQIETLEGRIEKVNRICGDPDSYGDSSVDMSKLQNELSALEVEIEEKMERWERLSEFES
jgi:ATP-binding cassette subfamily F protein uup